MANNGSGVPLAGVFATAAEGANAEPPADGANPPTLIMAPPLTCAILGASTGVSVKLGGIGLDVAPNSLAILTAFERTCCVLGPSIGVDSIPRDAAA